MEHEFRDAEMALTMAEMRSDVESLQKSVLRERIKRGDTKAKLPEAAALLEPGVSVTRRTTRGGGSPAAVADQIERFRARLDA